MNIGKREFPGDEQGEQTGKITAKKMVLPQLEDIPKVAKWTKISRRLLNPEALERVSKRDKVRNNFVVVFGVVTKQEIHDFTISTQSICAERDAGERRVAKAQFDEASAVVTESED